jgi:hypothetical protein
VKIVKRLCIVLVLVCGLLAVRANPNTKVDILTQCLNACGSAWGTCTNNVEYAYIACVGQCSNEEIACNAEAWSNYNWCIQFRCGNEWNTGACGEQCDGQLAGDLNICSSEAAICGQSPYEAGCEGDYTAGMQNCEGNEENCEADCYRNSP